jgi:hypothetical protein
MQSCCSRMTRACSAISERWSQMGDAQSASTACSPTTKHAHSALAVATAWGCSQRDTAGTYQPASARTSRGRAQALEQGITTVERERGYRAAAASCSSCRHWKHQLHPRCDTSRDPCTPAPPELPVRRLLWAPASADRATHSLHRNESVAKRHCLPQGAAADPPAHPKPFWLKVARGTRCE